MTTIATIDPHVPTPPVEPGRPLGYWIAKFGTEGYLVTSETPTKVVLVKPKQKTNHILHLVLSVLTFWLVGG